MFFRAAALVLSDERAASVVHVRATSRCASYINISAFEASTKRRPESVTPKCRKPGVD
ncbi:protein of unknown function (plasmid) [Azospirillum baldaniorum]|uniref:Uncharacterized protein n=1 Tax=Azospirillum baldaniorum TaxID=1064539 RepID=A0A9P1NRZ3_9PROT|nr:protein of unknown function [Azospirillum baldaniorum]